MQRIQNPTNKYAASSYITEEGAVLPRNKVYDFLHIRKYTYVLSGILILISLALVIFKGLNFGLDFTGGTVADVSLTKEMTTTELKNKLEVKYPGLELSQSSDGNFIIRIPAKVASNNLSIELFNFLKNEVDPQAVIKSLEFVGPKVGEELIQASVYSIIATIIMMLMYISFRFQWKLSFGAIAALLHDVIITVGIFALFDIDIDLNFVAAILSVVGYSVNDTIVVFDRMRENLRKLRRGTPYYIINISLNQTWARTLMTSITTLIVVVLLYVFGGESMKSFSIALLIGIFVGTYSSIYIAVSISYDLNLSREDMTIKKVDKDSLEEY